MRALFTFALAMGMAFAACTDGFAPTEPGGGGFSKVTHDTYTLDPDERIENACCSTFIRFSGTVNTLSTVRLNSDGTYSGNAHFNFMGVSGTDDEGRTYRVVGGGTNQTTMDVSSVASTSREVMHVRMQAIGDGTGSCSYVFKQVMESSVDAEGNVTVVRGGIEIDCM